MMKLVLSFDEFIKPVHMLDRDLDIAAQYMEAATDNLCDFLENEFPHWDLEKAFNIEKADWDFDNKEIHIPMYVITVIDG